MNLDARPPRQRLGAQARREAILAAATEAFAASTFDQVSVGAVASAAGASEALVHKYFEGKVGLYAEVVRLQVERLVARQQEADGALPPNTSARDRVRVMVETTLDHVQELRAAWVTPYFTAPSESEQVQALRHEYRARFVRDLTSLLRHEAGYRDRFAFVGFLGFLQAASQAWVEQGCHPDARASLVTAALGALEGALGDWGALRDVVGQPGR